MTETLSHAHIDNTPDQPAHFSADQIQDQIEELGPLNKPEQTDDQAPSRFGATLVRITGALDKWANQANDHLTENALNRDDFRLAKEAQDDAYASYSENITHAAVIDEAYRLNDKYDQKAARQEARAEKIEHAKQFLGRIGRAGAKAAKRGFTTFADTVEGAAGVVGNKVETSISNGIDWLEAAPQRKQAAQERKQARRAERDAVKQERAEARLEAQREREAAKQERINAAREESRKRAAEALVRKAERHAKWQGRADKVSNAYTATTTQAIKIGRGAHRFGKRVAKTATSAYTSGVDAWNTH